MTTMTQSQLEQVLLSLLEACGVEVRHAEKTLVETDPDELLLNVPPSLWVGSVALHLADTFTACADLAGLLQPSAVLDTKNIPLLWAIVSEELRFHVFFFPLYSELIRERMLDVSLKDIGDGDFLLPSPYAPRSEELCRPGPPVSMLKAFGLSPSESVMVADSLAELASACERTLAVITAFAESANAGLRELGKKFADVQSAMLCLGDVLLRADDACYRLMRLGMRGHDT